MCQEDVWRTLHIHKNNQTQNIFIHHHHILPHLPQKVGRCAIGPMFRWLMLVYLLHKT